MIEYAILIVMVIFAAGFAWLWFIEQKKKRKRREALRQKEIER
jgi:preprotein translocase subunit YajC